MRISSIRLCSVNGKTVSARKSWLGSKFLPFSHTSIAGLLRCIIMSCLKKKKWHLELRYYRGKWKYTKLSFSRWSNEIILCIKIILYWCQLLAFITHFAFQPKKWGSAIRWQHYFIDLLKGNKKTYYLL